MNDKSGNKINSVFDGPDWKLSEDEEKRLSEARTLALNRIGTGSKPDPQRKAWPLTAGLAMSAVVALALFTRGVDQSPDDTFAAETLIVEGDFEIIESGDLELLNELEFLAWVEEELSEDQG